MTRRGFIGATAAACFAQRAQAGPVPVVASHPPLGDFVTVEGVRIHHLVMGEGPALVLIHGASGNLRDFTFSLAPRLASMGLRVAAFDRPGLGYSDRAPMRGWDPMVQARLLRGAAAALGMEQPVVLGHSLGAAVAMAWAVQAPHALRGVLSLAGATHPWGEGVGLFYTIGASPVLGGVARLAASLLVDVDDPQAVMTRLFKPNTPPPGYGAYIGVPLALRDPAFRNNAEDMSNLDAALAAQAPLYAGLPTPLEAIHGDADQTVWASVHAKPLVAQVANGRLTMLPGVGHMPHHAAEDAVVAGVARLAGIG